MKRTVRVSLGAWAKIHQQIAREYPHSVLLIRERMRKVLGFTTRHHQEWVDAEQANAEFNVLFHTGYWNDCIILDFYNDHKQTMFLLKYSDLLNDNEPRE